MRISERKEKSIADSCQHASAGFSLIEIMIATLVLVIIFIGWLRISNFQAVRRESLRRAAIEKAAGYLDVITSQASEAGYYRVVWTNDAYQVDDNVASEWVHPLFDDEMLIGYNLRVIGSGDGDRLKYQPEWPGDWAVIKLYDVSGVTTNEAGRAFSTMSLRMP